MPKIELSKGAKPSSVIISQNSKSVSVIFPAGGKSESGQLTLTNQYGNSVSFALDDNGFDELWSALWEFVKDRQH